MPVNLAFIPLVLLVGGAVFLVNGLRWRRQLGHHPRDWVAVSGTIIEVRRGGGDDEVRFPVVEYRGPDGLARRVHGAESAVPDLHRKGEKVQVLLDPSNPRRARLADLQKGAHTLTTLFLVTGLTLLVLGAASVLVLI
ncbi:DUF3592 domain-containing protein [Aeromicrobium sp.]|uniref:DUF3592 domain-containing protein n=1 Tax=Aeromicrobium sp. TaxID=1871063 RepID=UPI0019C21B5B|nr:DUF3592 domain-containing protein [Aeromicrobium sp.]MBC7633316.1 DUF3592 domain-containing protein [Aeromicrobium sp.]